MSAPDYYEQYLWALTWTADGVAPVDPTTWTANVHLLDGTNISVAASTRDESLRRLLSALGVEYLDRPSDDEVEKWRAVLRGSSQDVLATMRVVPRNVLFALLAPEER